MGGGWFGYVYVFLGCGAVVALLGGSTLLLYAWARMTRRRGVQPVVCVTALPSRGDGSDASSAG